MGGHWVRVSGFLGMVALVLGAGYFAYRVWAEYEMMYKPAQLRIGMGLLTLALALLGLSLAGRARRITKLAGIIVLASAVGTSVGIWLWAQCGALDLKYAAWSTLAAAFVVHALWGVVLLVAAPRIRV